MTEGMTSAAAAKAAAAAAKWAWDNQDKIEPRLKQFYRASKRRIFGRSPGILVLGAGGVGKTTLGRILSGRYDFLVDVDSEYEQSIQVQKFRSKKHSDLELMVVPGQEDRRPGTWPALLGNLAHGKELGIILCCAYGHHALSINHKYHAQYDLKDPDSFLPRLTEDRRKEEVRILDAIAPSLQQNIRPTWLLTLVGKEDLWTHDERAVREFYTTGSYGRKVAEILKGKGNRLFRHEVVFGSLVIRNFVDGRGAVLKKNQSGYDHERQVRSLRHLFETIAALEAWKAD